VHAQVPVEVASFLLNEKRSEIAKIELQQRINVLLVPNKSLETPHYKLERLKHDDPRLERIEASYKMAEEIEDATTVTRRSQEPTNKQTPVIKGVLPDAPAPVAQAKPEIAKPAPKAVQTPAVAATAPAAPSTGGGLFAWLKNLFGSSATPQAPVVPAKKEVSTPESRRDNEPRDNERREGRRGGRRGERSDAVTGESRAPREGSRENSRRSEGRDNEARPTRSERPERAERMERSERPNGERPQRDNRRGEARSEPRNEVRVETSAELSAENTEGRTDRSPRAERSEGQGRRERGEGRRDRADRGERRPDDKSPTEPTTNESSGNLAESSDNSAAEINGSENTSERRERRSRDRYGRDRRERNAEPRQENPTEQEITPTGDALVQPISETMTQERPAPRSYFERAQQAAAPASTELASAANDNSVAMVNPTATSTDSEPLANAALDHTSTAAVHASPEPLASLPVMSVPVASAPLAIEPIALPSETPNQAHVEQAPKPEVAPVVQGLPSAGVYELPVERLQQVAHDSGLIWVNSDAEKITAVQAAIAAEPQVVRVPRERPAAVVLNEGPLVLVETRKDLNQLKVPF
jgi:ribonuclease E